MASYKAIVPKFGKSTGWFQVPRKEPAAWFPVWISPEYKLHKDSSGTTLYDRLHELFYNVGRVSSIGFYEYEYNQATWRFHYLDGAQIEYWSKYWRQYASGLGSVYFTVNPNDRTNIYTGGRLKASQGGRPLSPINAVRIPGHAWITLSMGWYPEQSSGSPPHAMRNPNMSGEIAYPTTTAGIIAHGLAGWDFAEINKWQALAAKYDRFNNDAWLWKED